MENIVEKLSFVSIGLDYGSGTKEGKLGKTTMTAVGFTAGFEKVYVLLEYAIISYNKYLQAAGFKYKAVA